MDYGMARDYVKIYLEMLAESDEPRRFDMAIESLKTLQQHIEQESELKQPRKVFVQRFLASAQDLK
jgi:GDP-D-mannose dehydratase